MKLVRDNLPELYARGELTQRLGDPEEKKFKFEKVDSNQRKTLLALKLSEELGEILSASNREALVEELGDFQEVFHAFIKACGISSAEIDIVNYDKQERLGTFNEGWTIDWR